MLYMYTNPAFFFWLRAETTQQRGNDLRCCMLLSVPDLCYLPFCFFAHLGLCNIITVSQEERLGCTTI